MDLEGWLQRSAGASRVIDEDWLSEQARRQRVGRLFTLDELDAALARVKDELPRAPSEQASLLHTLLLDLVRIRDFMTSPAGDTNTQVLEMLREMQQMLLHPPDIRRAMEEAMDAYLVPVTTRLEAHEERLDRHELRIGLLERWVVAHLEDVGRNHARDVRNEVLRLVALLVLLIGGSTVWMAESVGALPGSGVPVLWLSIATLCGILLLLSFRNGLEWRRVDMDREEWPDLLSGLRGRQ